MSCPTCDHTMQAIGVSGTVFWCPRCGTISTGFAPIKPFLVARIDMLEQLQYEIVGTALREKLSELWQKEGIFESIHLPHERKQP